MDLFFERIRAAYRTNPEFFIGFILLSAIVGIFIGYRLLGPALFG